MHNCLIIMTGKNERILLPLSYHEYDLSGCEEIQENRKESSVSVIPRENLENELNQNGPNLGNQKGREQSEPEDEKTDFKDKSITTTENDQENDFLANPREIIHIILLSIGVITSRVVCAIPWTTIPRSNSIIHQSRWMEMILPMTSTCILMTPSDVLNLVIWINERSLMTMNVSLRIFFAKFTPFVVLYVSSYIIWCEHFGFNHPNTTSCIRTDRRAHTNKIRNHHDHGLFWTKCDHFNQYWKYLLG